MRKFTNFLIAGLLLFVAQVAIYAQTGSIAGTVVDNNGAVIPNASVELKGESGQNFTVVTNDSGNYRFSGVAAGTYTVTVTLQGFKKSVVSNIKVDIGTPTTANVVLSAGEISEIVQVSSGRGSSDRNRDGRNYDRRPPDQPDADLIA
jgi:Carboxypeptidase regulatory-like domain